MRYNSFNHTFGFESSDEQDYATGLRALEYFHQKASEFANYEFSINDLISSLGTQPDIKVSGIGLAANVNDVDDNKLREIMFALAEQAQGQVPNHFMIYTNAIGQTLSNPSFMDAFKYTLSQTSVDATESFKQIGDTVLNVGSGILKTANFISKLTPILLVGGLGLAAWFYLSKGNKILALAKNPNFNLKFPIDAYFTNRYIHKNKEKIPVKIISQSATGRMFYHFKNDENKWESARASSGINNFYIKRNNKFIPLRDLIWEYVK